MDRELYKKTEEYMLGCCTPCVHDASHVYRVLYAALAIAKGEGEKNIHMDVLVLACLLHDVGRIREEEVPHRSHADIGAEMAWNFLSENGFDKMTAAHVRDCVRTHSSHGSKEPQSIEAKILFDADSLDLTGALGCARAMRYGALIKEPLYLLERGTKQPVPGSHRGAPSLMREYNRRLKNMPDSFYTKTGKAMAKKRQKTMDAYFKALKTEIATMHMQGQPALEQFLAKKS